MKTTLLVMAAGLGSRYGGNKQLSKLGPHGEILLEYAVYDAIHAGFDKLVLVIRRSMEEEVRALVGDRFARSIEVAYAFQEYDSLPGGFVPPADRVKPYGTVHAVLCAKQALTEPFAVINADDYYGREDFTTMAESLHGLAARENAASMVAYQLANTLSANGTVTRGVCRTDEAGHLARVEETYRIGRQADGVIRGESEAGEVRVLEEDTPVSMNFWGFAPSFLTAAEEELTRYLREEAPKNPLKAEYVLPTLVDALMKQRGLTVDVLRSPAAWFGVTYREDRDAVMAELKKLHDGGFYPESLF